MLKKIVVAVVAGIILAALLLPALAGNSILRGKIIATQDAKAAAVTDFHKVSLTK